MARLVKGAYWDSEVKRAQMQGLAGYPVYSRKANTDISYLACAAKMIDAKDAFYGQFATHNAHTVATILERMPKGQPFEFQRLHGMGEDLYEQVVAAGHACRVYAPVGSHEDLLPYLVRRLLENGANTSFVNRIADPGIPVESVIADPVATVAAQASVSNPKIPLPAALYGDRVNSSGFAFADEAVSAPIVARIQALAARNEFGQVPDADANAARAALDKAGRARIPSANERAAMLERAADLIEKDRVELMAVLAREAGKALPDGLGEVREAADFCRYYAMLTRRHFAEPENLAGPTGESNRLQLVGRGPFVCISPWNFPLAIFVGQVAAAFAAGNAVIAKPAEQTPRVAARAVRLLHEAGIPEDAVVLVPGRGEIVGAALVADLRTAGVAFTGSTATARAINRTLAARDGPIVPFIAETGGLNAMFVDSSALAEQVVTDVIASAFNSAGQRCSALRVLCLQREIAPRVIELLQGATAELKVGDPARLDIDVGPVIDAEALAMLEAHAAKMDREAKLLCKAIDAERRGAALLRAARLRDREPRRHRSRGVRSDPARGALRLGRPREDCRCDQREGLRPHDGHPQPHRGHDRARAPARLRGQPLREPQHDRRHGRRAALRRRRPFRHRPQGRRPALSLPLRHRTHRHGEHRRRRRQCFAYRQL